MCKPWNKFLIQAQIFVLCDCAGSAMKNDVYNFR